MTKSNRHLAADFRALMTSKFYAIDDSGDRLTNDELDAALRSTKPWRNELWRAFREIEDRLDPLATLARNKANEKSN